MSCMHELGLSAQAIAGHGSHHPHDPADLLRCIKYAEGRWTTTELQDRMAGRSPEWDRLLPVWDPLVQLLKSEMENRKDGRAPATFIAMQTAIYAGETCRLCDGTGRGAECLKCKGTGRRSGGHCRAWRCHDGADFCHKCLGRGYTRVGAA